MVCSKENRKCICSVIALAVSSLVLFVYVFQRSPDIFVPTIDLAFNFSAKWANGERVLILYVWADIDKQSLGNLQFFIRHAVHISQPADYYFILQRVNKSTVDESRLPRLPPNAHYLQHENECYDFGTFGWFLASKIVDTSLYKYFIFMNVSVRGPFLVSPLINSVRGWFTIFTERLTNQIKLVGPTISCQIKPHVQSYLMAIDHVGFAILTSNQSGVFNCHGSYNDAVLNGEIASSQLILRANYQIASLQTKYQGWDFRRRENRHCNHGVNPIYHDDAIDGISHDPYELVFVKFKGSPPFDTTLERKASVYQRWLERQPE